MADVKHTPGPWTYFVGNANGRGLIRVEVCGTASENCGHHIASFTRGHENEANARLIAAAPDLLAACKLHAAWAKSEKDGPKYPEGVTRDKGGDAIWRAWWEANLDLCARAEEATRAAIAKATGEA